MLANPSTERRTVSVVEAARRLGIGRQLGYELARRGELPGCIRLGTRYVVSESVLERVLSGDLSFHAPGNSDS